jgi:uncharacterized protein YjfI (DUF2170 family)
MSVQGSSIIDNFSDFLYTTQPGIISDVYADTRRVLIQQRLDGINNKEKITNFLDDNIKKSKEIEKEIQGMIYDFQTTANEKKKTPIIRNRFPYGETVIYTTKKDPDDKLDSILDTKIDQLTLSGIAFARLCKTLLPKNYKEGDTDILRDIFGSIADYPIIDKQSNGMMSINHLFMLFDEFYMNYNTYQSGSNKRFRYDGTGINKKKFFDRFLEISSLQIENKEPFNDKYFKTDIENIYEFNPDLWYADFNIEEFNKIFNENGKDYMTDSYGGFFKAPALNILIEKAGAFGTPRSATSGPEITTFDPNTGMYDIKVDGIFSNKEKVFCLLFQEESSSPKNILYNYRFPTKTQSAYEDSQKVLLYLYNTKSTRPLTSPNSTITFKFPIIVKNTKWITGSATISPGLKTQSAGGKKKSKGGSITNLFDPSSTPTFLAKRIPKKFNPVIFEKSIRRFQRENDKYKLSDLCDKIIKSSDLPIFYHDLKQKLGAQNISYEELRYLFHWSSIYTTYKKLLIHFFSNIAVCYKYYSSVIVEKEIKDSKNINKYELIKMPAYIDKLIVQIEKIKQRLNFNLLEIGQPNNFRNLFVGFDIMNQGETFNNAATGKPFPPNITEDRFFKNYFLLAISPNDFKTFLQLFCLNYNISFGGIPITLSTEGFNKNIKDCFIFFLRYRFLGNKNLIELLELYKTQQEQKVPEEKIERISTIVTDKFEKITEKASIFALESMNNYKIIIMQTIAFGIKSYITLLRDIFSNLSSPSKSTSRIVSKKKNSSIDSIENMQKVGEFKLTIYKIIQQIKKKDGYDQNLYLFLYGQLFQFIYRVDQLVNAKINMTPEQFKEIFADFGIDFNMSDDDIETKSKQITEILTDKNKSIKLKERFFGLFKPKVETLKNNAKKLITTSYDPEALKAQWWVDIEKKYLRISGYRKLFVIAIQPVINAGKFSKLNVWLIDVFATAQSSTKPTVRNMGIKTIEEVDKNGVVIKEYYGDNNLIMLNPWMRTMREFKGDFQKWFTKDTKWWSNPSGWKKSLQTFFHNKSKKLQKSQIGSLFAEYLGIRKQKDDDDSGFKNSELIMRLIQGKLDSYVQNNNNKSNKIKPAILMGYDEDQLKSILIKHIDAMKKGNRFAKNTNSYNDWQLYIIQEKDYSSVESFRLWAFNLLMSKPWVFNEENMKNKYSIPISNFRKMQVPFKNFFTKIGDFGVSADLLEFFKLITAEKFKEITTSNNNRKNWLAILKENKNFITQTELSELEMPRETGDVEIASGISLKFTKFASNAFNTNSTVSRVPSSVPTSHSFALRRDVGSSSNSNSGSSRSSGRSNGSNLDSMSSRISGSSTGSRAKPLIYSNSNNDDSGIPRRGTEFRYTRFVTPEVSGSNTNDGGRRAIPSSASSRAPSRPPSPSRVSSSRTSNINSNSSYKTTGSHRINSADVLVSMRREPLYNNFLTKLKGDSAKLQLFTPPYVKTNAKNEVLIAIYYDVKTEEIFRIFYAVDAKKFYFKDDDLESDYAYLINGTQTVVHDGATTNTYNFQTNGVIKLKVEKRDEATETFLLVNDNGYFWEKQA